MDLTSCDFLVRHGVLVDANRANCHLVGWYELFKEHPYVGTGAGTFRIGSQARLGRSMSAHSLYVETAAEDGIVGLGLLAALLITVVPVLMWRSDQTLLRLILYLVLIGTTLVANFTTLYSLWFGLAILRTAPPRVGSEQRGTLPCRPLVPLRREDCRGREPRVERPFSRGRIAWQREVVPQRLAVGQGIVIQYSSQSAAISSALPASTNKPVTPSITSSGTRHPGGYHRTPARHGLQDGIRWPSWLDVMQTTVAPENNRCTSGWKPASRTTCSSASSLIRSRRMPDISGSVGGAWPMITPHTPGNRLETVDIASMNIR